MQAKIVLYKKVSEDVLAMLQARFLVLQFDGVNDANRHAFIAALVAAVILTLVVKPQPAAAVATLATRA